MSGPTWYEVLGVPADATAEQIKAAWREATDMFEPGSGKGQFRMFNEAADVLLDPERRTEYDASLTPATPTADPAPDTGDPAPDTGEPAQVPTRRRALRVGMLAVLAVLAIASVLVAGYLYLDVHRDDVRTAAARDQAPAAAERALTTLLAYDYRHLPADKAAADDVITKRYADGYTKGGKTYDGFDKIFDLLAKGKDGQPAPAVATQTVVTAQVLNSAVVDASPDRVRVLVFVNQTSTKAGKTPAVFQNRVVATMVKRGGGWLVDDVTSY